MNHIKRQLEFTLKRIIFSGPPSFSNLFSGTDRPNDPLNPYLNMKVPQVSTRYSVHPMFCSPSTLAAKRTQVRPWWRCGSRARRTGERGEEPLPAPSSLTARPCEFHKPSHIKKVENAKSEGPLKRLNQKQEKEGRKEKRMRRETIWVGQKLSLPLGCATQLDGYAAHHLNNSQRNKLLQRFQQGSSRELKWTPI